MTENKITAICQECNKQFEYTLKPGFPRKYCVECSEIKKASYAARQPVSADEQKFNEDMAEPEEFPVVKPGIPAKVEQQASVKEYHLTQEQQRSNALRCAIEVYRGNDFTKEQFWTKVNEFKEFIENGN